MNKIIITLLVILAISFIPSSFASHNLKLYEDIQPDQLPAYITEPLAESDGLPFGDRDPTGFFMSDDHTKVIIHYVGFFIYHEYELNGDTPTLISYLPILYTDVSRGDYLKDPNRLRLFDFVFVFKEEAKDAGRDIPIYVDKAITIITSEKYEKIPITILGHTTAGGVSNIIFIQIYESYFEIHSNDNDEYLISDLEIESAITIITSDDYADIPVTILSYQGGNFFIQIYESYFAIYPTTNGDIIITDDNFKDAIDEFFGIVDKAEPPSNSTSQSKPESTPEIIEEEELKKKGGGCADCTPPTLGVNSDGKRMVDNGIQINGETIEVDYFYTEMPMQYTEIGKNNTILFKVYENNGPHNIKYFQFALGVKEVGSPINSAQALIGVELGHFKDDIYNPVIENIHITDPDGIIGNLEGKIDLTSCIDMKDDCLLIVITYSYAKVPISPVLGVNSWDYGNNSFDHFFNHGITVIDPNYVEPVIEVEPERECTDHTTVMTRNNCHFPEYREWNYKQILESIQGKMQ